MSTRSAIGEFEAPYSAMRRRVSEYRQPLTPVHAGGLKPIGFANAGSAVQHVRSCSFLLQPNQCSPWERTGVERVY